MTLRVQVEYRSDPMDHWLQLLSVQAGGSIIDAESIDAIEQGFRTFIQSLREYDRIMSNGLRDTHHYVFTLPPEPSTEDE